jgi:MFS transporter, DHA1 family, multidrug resistance protein
VFLGEHLQLQPQQFFWFFCITIGGIMAGAWWSGRLAGQLPPKRQIRRGFRVMVTVSLLNVLLNAMSAYGWFPLHPAWAMPLVGLFAFGWALMVPVVTLLVLDLAPDRRGMASSLQAFVGGVANGLVAGALTPLVMHSTVALAITSTLMLGVGLSAWAWVKTRLP